MFFKGYVVSDQAAIEGITVGHHYTPGICSLHSLSFVPFFPFLHLLYSFLSIYYYRLYPWWSSSSDGRGESH